MTDEQRITSDPTITVDEEPAPRTEPSWAVTDEPSVPPREGDPYPWFWDAQKAGVDPRAPKRFALRAMLAWFIAALLGAGVGGGAVYLRLGDSGIGEVRVVKPPITDVATVPENAAARVAQVVLPSIVQIRVAGVAGEGLGSGVVYSSDGYIITNNHVVEGADAIEVGLPTGDTVAGALIGTARNTGVDIAVIKVVPREPLTPATLGSTVDLHVGDLAVAIGSPFGLDATVTAGIISALHRNQSLGGERFTDAIQTDAPINPGNSGGALANARGEVVGINTAIIGGSGGNVGVGFAIPVGIARKVTEQIIKTGRAELAYLGISGDNLPDGKGARVSEASPGDPAALAGIKADDVIVSFDGKVVRSMDELIGFLTEQDVGDVVKIGILRAGKAETLSVTLRARPER